MKWNVGKLEIAKVYCHREMVLSVCEATDIFQNRLHYICWEIQYKIIIICLFKIIYVPTE